MLFFQSDSQNYIDQLCTISPSVRDFIDGELYRGNAENIYEFTSEDLFPSCIKLLLKELQLLGISFSLHDDELLSDSENIKACIALREFFDAAIFKQAIGNNEEVIECCRTLFQSQDIFEKDYAAQIIKLAIGKKIGDLLQLEQMTSIVDQLISNSAFTAHISTILDQHVTKSKITTENMIEYGKYVHEVVGDQLVMVFTRLQLIADNHVFENSPDQLINSADYFNFWTNFDNIPDLIWLSNLTSADLEDSQVRTIMTDIYFTRHRNAIFSVYHYQGKLIPVSNLKLILLHHVLINFIKSRANQYPRLLHVIGNQDENPDLELKVLKSIATLDQQIQIAQLLLKLSAINEE